MSGHVEARGAGAAMGRRGFLRRLALSSAGLGAFPRGRAADAATRRVRFGLISDIHPDMLPDGAERVLAFVSAMEKAQAEFIVQLGDFCWPVQSNRRYLEAWNTFRGPRHHVLGNHDMDEGCTREQTVAFCGMPGSHYAFPAGPLRGLVLDGNEPGGKASGYRRFIAEPQLAWLEGELSQADRPVAMFIHQPFHEDGPDCLENAAAVRSVLERAEKRKPGTVLAVFNGHLHMDFEQVVNGVRYIGINSAAYWWLNNPAARRETYPPEAHKAHKYLTHVAAYRDPLWALVTVDLEQGEMVIEGRRSEWVGPSPWDRGETTDRSREFIHPWISDRRCRWRPLRS